MKVLYVNVTIPVYTHPLIEKLVSKGCELIMLISANKDGTVGEGVGVHSLDKTSYRVCYSPSKRKWYGKPALTRLKKILEEEQPDILMIGWPYFLQLFFERSILKLMKKKNIGFIIQEIPFQTPPFGQLNYFKRHPIYNENMELESKGIFFYIRALFTMFIRRYLYKRVDATVNYASLAKNILPSYGVKQESIFIRYNTSDTDSMFAVRNKIEENVSRHNDRSRILHIGRLVKWKRVDLLLDAFSIIASSFPESDLIIIGDGPEKETLMCRTKEKGLEGRVFFTGAIRDPYELGLYMYESTVYVLAGMGGLSINDAMCFSLPVICSVCDGTERDLITDGINGLFFKEGDINDLADKITRVLSNKSKAKEMGEASYHIIKEKINLETVSDNYMKAFDYVMKKRVLH